MLDILGSTVVGGFLLIILLNMNQSAIQNNYDFGGERIVQQNLVEVIQLIEYDFRKIGYTASRTNLIPQSTAIIHADSSSITFQTDLPVKTTPVSDQQYGDGVIDTVKYYLGPTSELTATPNPNDRILYRVVNHDAAKGASLGVTRFKLTYYDVFGNQLGTATNPLPSVAPFGIVSIKIDVAVENPYAYANNYTYDKRAMWRQVRFSLHNLKKR